MAEGAVGFALQKADLLLERERKLLAEIRREVKDIKDELESMVAFLKDADTREETDGGIKVWVKQVREVAHDTEDVIDEFMFRLARKQDEHGFLGFLHKSYRSLMTIRDRHRIAAEIEHIKARVQKVSERSQRYRFHSSGFSTRTWHDPRGDTLLLMEEAELVGIDRPRDDLIRYLLREDVRLRVVSVVGMGGLGKTTLVKKVFDSEQVRGSFQHHAWVTVSHSLRVEHILRDAISLLFKEIKQAIPQEVTTMKEGDLKVTLREFLRNKRFLIVFDDIWRKDIWKAIKVALPDGNCGSRVMLTTRLVDLDPASSSSNEARIYRYDLKHLSPEESWTLFCKKTFRENGCPQHLERVSRSILKRCQGLPLAIVAIGGVLSTKDMARIDEWDLIHRSLGSELESNDVLKSMKRIISLSYIDLPFHLKHCFLYFSLFPEDYLLKCSRLVRLWIAEGFVEETEGKTLEEVGESYVSELINRSLLQVGEIADNGRVGSCRVHDITHEIIVSKSREENFGAIISAEQANSQSWREKFRRISIHKKLGSLRENHRRLCNLRSLFLFALDGTHLSSSSMFLNPLLSGFRLLKVLDLRGTPLKTFPKKIVNLFNLRYLCLRDTMIARIPDSIGKLQNLETLDLKNTYVTSLPAEIEMLRRLRHLVVTHNNDAGMRYKKFNAPMGVKFQVMGIGHLVALQTLYYIDVSKDGAIVAELEKLTQLRKLGVSRLRNKDGRNLCRSIQKMRNLHTLHVASIHKEEVLDLDSLSSPPPLLQRLFITGKVGLKLPKWIHSLHNLTVVALIWSELRGEDSLQPLQALPNLLTLCLRRAYMGRKLTFVREGFQSLKVLYLIELRRLRCISMQEGTMPNLRELYIDCCEELLWAPEGIECLKSLTEMTFVNMPDGFGTELRIKAKHHPYYNYKHGAHIPSINFFRRTDEGFEGYVPM